MLFRALIFDLDGVLIDTETLHQQAKRAAFTRFNLAVPEGLYARFRGRSDEDMARHVTRAYGSAGLDYREVLSAKHEIFSGLHDGIALVPGALDFLRAARARFEKLALATSATRANRGFAFARFGLAPFFDAVVDAEDITRTKPDPEPYRVAASRLGVPAAECRVVEDSVNGILSAKAAGCAVAAIATTFAAEELAPAGPTWLAAGFSELDSIWKLTRAS